MIDFVTAHWSLIATMLWATCELLAQLPQVKANSVGMLVVNGVIDAVKGQASKPGDPVSAPPTPAKNG